MLYISLEQRIMLICLLVTISCTGVGSTPVAGLKACWWSHTPADHVVWRATAACTVYALSAVPVCKLERLQAREEKHSGNDYSAADMVLHHLQLVVLQRGLLKGFTLGSK